MLHASGFARAFCGQREIYLNGHGNQPSGRWHEFLLYQTCLTASVGAGVDIQMRSPQQWGNTARTGATRRRRRALHATHKATRENTHTHTHSTHAARSRVNRHSI
ncbi:uncharacterized protein [Drosophila virilis]|uniref:uncharacterized protein n=1 Tax=Drosophila virilis TaxID=7244 RepID=UPI0038B29E8F